MFTSLRSVFIVLALIATLVTAEPPSRRIRVRLNRPLQYRRRVPVPARQEFLPESEPTGYPTAQDLRPRKPFLNEQSLGPAQTYGPPKQTYGPPSPPQQTYGPPSPPQQTYGPPSPQKTYGAPPVPEVTTETSAVQGQPEDFVPNPEAEEFLRIRQPQTSQLLIGERQLLPARQTAIAVPPQPAVVPVPVVDTPLPVAAAPQLFAAPSVIATTSTVASVPQWSVAQPFSAYYVVNNAHPFAYSSQFQTW